MNKQVLTIVLSVVFGLATFTSSGCMYMTGIDGNGKVKKETRNVSSFDAIKIGGAFEVYLTQGNESLVVEADENLLDIITTEVRGGTLVISTDKNIKNAEELNLYIGFKDLERIDISGAVELKADGRLKFDELDIEGSGASEIELDLTADRLSLDFSGASELDLAGSAGTCNIDISGASEIQAYDLELKDCTIDISGAGEAKLNVSDKLKASVSGAGSIRYEGNPSVDSRVSGAGSVRKR